MRVVANEGERVRRGDTHEGQLALTIESLVADHGRLGRLRDAAERGESVPLSADRAAAAGKLVADALRVLRQPEVRDE